MESEIAMTRPVWNHRQYFTDKWRDMDITVLICQRKTKDITQLCLESLLRFYPDIPVLLVDGDSQDESTTYCRWMAVKHPNIILWERANANGGKHTSHGETLDGALCFHITTKYVLLLDSDTIIKRGGWIEDILTLFTKEDYRSAFAIGSLMLMSKKNEAILGPSDENDVLKYAHPSCSVIDRDKYMQVRNTETELPDGRKIKNTAQDHGAPLVWTMIGAEQLGYTVHYYPVDKYVSHLSGSSWCEPRTIWPDNHCVIVRPFVTFLLFAPVRFTSQNCNDYEAIHINAVKTKQAIVIPGEEPKEINNYCYKYRFVVRGDYVCQPDIMYISKEVVENAIQKAIELSAPDEFESDGLKFVKRELWQHRECLT